MTKYRFEFWLDDDNPEQAELIKLIENMKEYRFFALSVRYGLQFFGDLQDRIAQKQGKFDRYISLKLPPERAAEITYNALYNPIQPSTHLEPNREQPEPSEEINFSSEDLTKTTGDNMDKMLGSIGNFFD